jgi:hypothetical protein
MSSGSDPRVEPKTTPCSTNQQHSDLNPHSTELCFAALNCKSPGNTQLFHPLYHRSRACHGEDMCRIGLAYAEQFIRAVRFEGSPFLAGIIMAKPDKEVPEEVPCAQDEWEWQLILPTLDLDSGSRSHGHPGGAHMP